MVAQIGLRVELADGWSDRRSGRWAVGWDLAAQIGQRVELADRRASVPSWSLRGAGR